MFKVLRNKRGITLINIMVIIGISVSLLVIVGGNIFKANEDRKVSEIASNVNILSSISKSYFSANNHYPVIENKPLSSFTDGTALKEFHKILVNKLSTTSEEIDKRVKLVDMKTLYTDKYLSANIEGEDEYVNDTNTGKVYHISKNATLAELEEIADQLIKDSNEIIDLTVNDKDRIDVEVDGKTMTNMIVSVSQGKKLLVGGGNNGNSPTDIKLALLEFEDVKGETISKVTDLTPKVKGGTLDTPITDMRLLDTGKVLVHYYDTSKSKLAYEVIEF